MTTSERIDDTKRRIAAVDVGIQRLRTDLGNTLGTVRVDVKTAHSGMAIELRNELAQIEKRRASEVAEQKKKIDKIRIEYDRSEAAQKTETANRVKQTGLRLRDVARGLGENQAFIATSNMKSEDLVPSLQVREFVTVGHLNIPGTSKLDRDLPRVPAPVPFVDSGHLIIEAPSGTPDSPDQTFRGLMTSLVAQTYASAPPGQMVLTVFNPRSSKVLAGFRPTGAETVGLLKVLPPTRDALEKSLEEHLAFTQRAESSIGTHSSLGELVRNTGQHEHQYHALVIVDGPSDWTPKSIDLLEKLMASGSKAGLSVLLHCDPTAQAPDRVDITRLYKYGSVLARKGRYWTLNVPGATAQGAPLEPVPAIPEEAQTKLMELVVSAAKDGSLPSIPFDDLAERSSQTSEHGLSITMGKKGTQRTEFVLGDTVSNIQNVLVGGRAGSGKTNLLKVMIYSMAARYPREELELFLLDFKEGGDFMPFVVDDEHNKPLPNATVVSRDCDAGFGLATLRHFDREMTARAQLTSKNNVSNIWDLRDRTGTVLPRWVLVIDEFQGLFNGPTYQEATELLENFVRKGRSFGLHVILATQTLSGVHFAGDKDKAIFENISGRVVLQLGPGEFTRFMEAGNDEGDQLRYRGQAIFNPMGGRKSENQHFVVARADAQHTNKLQNELYRSYKETSAGKAHLPFIYRGDEIVSAAQLLKENPSPTHIDGELPAWYGREDTIDPPVAAATLAPVAGSHVLLLGGDEETTRTAISTLQTAVLSAVAAADESIDVVVFEELIRKYRSGALIEEWLDTLAALGANVIRFDGETTQEFMQTVSDASAARRRTIVVLVGAENSDFAQVADENNHWRTLVREMPRRNVNVIGHWSDLRDVPGDKHALKNDYKTMLIFGKDEQLAVNATGRSRYDLPTMSNNRTIVFSAKASQDGVTTVTSLQPLTKVDLVAFRQPVRRPYGSIRVAGTDRTAVHEGLLSQSSTVGPVAPTGEPIRRIREVPDTALNSLIPQQQTSTAEGASAVLGEGTDGVVTARLGTNGAANLLVAGWPLTGTQAAAKRLVYALAAQHSKTELRIDLIDSEVDGEFSEFSDGTLPQLSTVAHTSNESRIGQIFHGYVTEVQRRTQLFTKAESPNYQGYRNDGHELSRWLVLWTEFGEACTPTLNAQVEWLAKFGPAAGLHLVLSDAAPVSNHAHELPEFFANSGRLLLYLKSNESNALLGNDLAARLIRRQQAVYTQSPEHNATVTAIPTFDGRDENELRLKLGGLE
ncbi:FtsK/SpoIIIE domain-containing protein [Brevibacterium aurantiacum]|nr:FtsK/SpoIIIE domain-containing protein [Brevibacterium aurantiacum]